MSFRWQATLASLASLAVAASMPVSAQTLCDLPVSAFLTDSAGAPLEGAVDVELRFYLEESDELPLECRSFPASSLDEGWLRATVDACATPDPGDCGVNPIRSLLTGGAERVYVGIVVGGGDELLPRVAVGAVPYAISAFDSQRLGGAEPDAFEAAGTASGLLDAHASEADAHHPSDSAGVHIRPSGADIGDITVDGSRIDFGPETDDELNAEIVRTLTGGGEADALHTHASGSGGSGGCYVAWGVTTCLDGWTAAYDGYSLALSSSYTRDVSALYCVEETSVVESGGVSTWFRLLGPLSEGVEGDYQSPTGELPCAVCCR